MICKLVTLAFALGLTAPGLLLASKPVNINQADAATIARSLDGIGASRAQAIVAWRDAHGPFKKAEDLKHVKGIGKATIERNRSAILLADATAGKEDAAEKPAPRHEKSADGE
ncbi:MAG: helix-hairpin-helix domain-containing protein [Rhodanobacter sp.]